jgi:hypothetical protein
MKHIDSPDADRSIALINGLGMDVSDEAHKEGITMPVVISTPLAEQLTPNPYLASLGLSLEQRITNLLKLLRANLDTSGNPSPEKRYAIPLSLVRGPFIREDSQVIIAVVHQNGEGEPITTLTMARETDVK